MRSSRAGYGTRSITAWLTILMATLALAACGGSGAGAGGKGFADLADNEVQSLVLNADSAEIDSSGKNPVTLTAIVKDGGNRALANQMVDISTGDRGSTLTIESRRTDANGRVTAQLSNTDPKKRDIVVRASVNGAGRTMEDTLTLQVSGTVLSINGPGTIAFSAGTTYTVSVRDSAGNKVAGVPVTLRSARGNGVAPSSANTDSQGQASFTVTGQVDGTDTLTAEALETSNTRSVTVSGTLLEFLVPGDASELDVAAGPHPLEIRLMQNGVPLVGQPIAFTATRGTLSASSATTDGSGQASVTISSTTAGHATVVATAPGDTSATRTLEFIASSPAKLSLQASPTVVGINLSEQGTRSSQLIAVVRDTADNPVKHVRVNFSSVVDPSHGRIEPAYAETDSAGRATASFIPGPTSSGPGGVELRATLPATGLTTTTKVTAARQELAVVVETGKTIEAPDATTYRMPWTALVTDSSGAPVVGAAVTAELEPLGFRTGRWIPGGTGWAQQVNATCASEDVNRNGLFEPDEDNLAFDVGRLGVLDPGQVAAAQILSPDGQTDDAGEAKIMINYPQGYAAWARYRLHVSISAPAGTESSATSDFWLPILAAHVNNADETPPGARSPVGPYGEGVGCPAL